MAVVAALELDHLVAAGVSTDQAQHSHAGLGAAVDEAHHLNAGYSVDHHFGQGVFQGTRCSEACLLYTSPSPRDLSTSRMPSSA